ncbi:MAG: glycerate kinase [Synergistaceae bacterium]|nr:glycerate kinase [Synergistaceae bacterium]MBP9626017.1 glycerate kinase [Synergistaceae bacterium]MBP9956976.1 glycerate kinase [Synergistaceae bacterium]
MTQIRKETLEIGLAAIGQMLPDQAVSQALSAKKITGNVVLVAVGKAAWRMAHAAYNTLGEEISRGIVITKHGHLQGPIGTLELYETGHPTPDTQSIAATARALEITKGLTPEDTVLFLLSGGGSSLFEKPLPRITLEDIIGITQQLLENGADIVAINTIRKRLSSVKGGRFAEHCAPAQVRSLILSDVLGDQMDSIASGPTCPDTTTKEQALELIHRYGLRIRPEILEKIRQEQPFKLNNIDNSVSGSVSELCHAAAKAAAQYGYTPLIVTTSLDCEAKEAGKMIASIAREIRTSECPLPSPCAVILGGETIVHLKGKGKGGRNQEIALSAAQGISGLNDTVILAIGSDGTDGPTDAAGGLVDGTTAHRLQELGIDITEELRANNAYPTLDACSDLVRTGPTGTNVNDLLLLICG